MTKHLIVAAVLLVMGGFGRAGEKDVIERLEKAGAGVCKCDLPVEEDGLAVQFLDVQNADLCLAELCELRRLRTLWLGGKNVTDAEMRTVGRLTGLKRLVLENAAVTDTGLNELTRLKNLERLFLDGTRVTDAGVRTVSSMRRLKWLTLNHTRVTNAGLKELAGLSALSYLSLDGCAGVTDDGIDFLARLNGLQEVRLRGAGVTAQGTARLRKALPNCTILGKE